MRIRRAGADGRLADWEDSADGALALVIVLDQFPLNMYRGTAEAFSAGIDLKDASTWEELDDVALRDRSYRGVRLCQAWEDMPQITIAAMEGLSVGAGCAIALSLICVGLAGGGLAALSAAAATGAANAGPAS